MLAQKTQMTVVGVKTEALAPTLKRQKVTHCRHFCSAVDGGRKQRDRRLLAKFASQVGIVVASAEKWMFALPPDTVTLSARLVDRLEP